MATEKSWAETAARASYVAPAAGHPAPTDAAFDRGLVAGPAWKRYCVKRRGRPQDAHGPLPNRSGSQVLFLASSSGCLTRRLRLRPADRPLSAVNGWVWSIPAQSSGAT